MGQSTCHGPQRDGREDITRVFAAKNKGSSPYVWLYPTVSCFMNNSILIGIFFFVLIMSIHLPLKGFFFHIRALNFPLFLALGASLALILTTAQF